MVRAAAVLMVNAMADALVGMVVRTGVMSLRISVRVAMVRTGHP